MDESLLSQLRKLRDEIRRIDAEREALAKGRDSLIREASEQRKTQRLIAVAAGVSPGRVHQIKSEGARS